MIDLDTRVKPRADVLVRALDDESVLLDLRTGTYFGLDAVGRRVWELLDERARVGQVVDGIVDEYDVSRPTAQVDVLALVGELLNRGLVEVVALA